MKKINSKHGINTKNPICPNCLKPTKEVFKGACNACWRKLTKLVHKLERKITKLEIGTGIEN